MNVDDFKKELLNLDTELDKEVSLSNLKLSAIVYENFALFESIKDKHQRKVKDNNAVKSCYSRKIQALLTKGGKFQKDGSPISEYQILNEMHRVRKQKGLIGSSTTENDNQGSILSPTSDLNGSGVVKVSTKQKKPSNGVKGELVPIKPVDIVMETEKINFEMKNYNADKVPLVWSAEDEYMYLEWKELAKKKCVKISTLSIRNMLEPPWNDTITNYFNAWINKAEKIKYDCK